MVNTLTYQKITCEYQKKKHFIVHFFFRSRFIQIYYMVIMNVQSYNSLYGCRWVEFSRKSVAKSVANMLNGEQIGISFKQIMYFYFILTIFV